MNIALIAGAALLIIIVVEIVGFLLVNNITDFIARNKKIKKTSNEKKEAYVFGLKVGTKIGYNQGKLDLEEQVNSILSFYAKNKNFDMTEDCIANLINYDYKTREEIRNLNFELNQHKQVIKDIMNFFEKKDELAEILYKIDKGEVFDTERKK